MFLLCLKVNQQQGFAMFSLLDAGGHVKPHYGPLNLRLRCMLPLILSYQKEGTVNEADGLWHRSRSIHHWPAVLLQQTQVAMQFDETIDTTQRGCYLKVGSEVRQLVEGQCVVFDDSFQHSSWNNTDGDRIVLIVDIWHPDLTLSERTDVEDLMQQFFNM